MSTITRPKPEHYQRANEVAGEGKRLAVEGDYLTDAGPYPYALGHVIAELAEAYAEIDALKRDLFVHEAAEEHGTEPDELRHQINERLTWHFDPPDCATLDTSRVRVDAAEWLPVMLEGELDTDTCCVTWRARLNSIDGAKALYDIAQEG